MIREKYINPFTDFGFKLLFGKEANKDLLMDFLNSFLPQKHQIAELDFRKTAYEGMVEADRKAFFDIFRKSKTGEHFIVEMQKAKHHFFKDRALFYTSYPIREEAKRGSEWTFELPPIYFFAILDFKLDEEKERQKVLRIVSLKDQDGAVFYDKLNFIFIQMPSFVKKETELETHQDKWLFFLQNLPSFDHIPDILREPVFEKGFGISKLGTLTQAEYHSYEQSLLTYIEMKGVVDTAFDEGMEVGIEKGIEKGVALGIEKEKTRQNALRKEEKHQMAKNLKQAGVALHIIIQATGLTEAEIEML